MPDDSQTPQQKRKVYLVAFFIAFGIDYLLSLSRGGGYKPTTIGLAVMITAVLFFVYSLIRNR